MVKFLIKLYKTTIAHKAHHCDNCSKLIEALTRYKKYCIKDSSHKLCILCFNRLTLLAIKAHIDEISLDD